MNPWQRPGVGGEPFADPTYSTAVQPYPHYLYPAGPSRAPSGATAVTAAISALLCAGIQAVIAVASFAALTKLGQGDGTDDGLGLFLVLGPLGWVLSAIGLASLFICLGLIVGGVALLCRSAAGAVIATIFAIFTLGTQLCYLVLPGPFLFGKSGAGMGALGLLAGSAIAVATTALALARPTRRWCRAPRMPAHPR